MLCVSPVLFLLSAFIFPVPCPVSPFRITCPVSPILRISSKSFIASCIWYFLSAVPRLSFVCCARVLRPLIPCLSRVARPVCRVPPVSCPASRASCHISCLVPPAFCPPYLPSPISCHRLASRVSCLVSEDWPGAPETQPRASKYNIEAPYSSKYNQSYALYFILSLRCYCPVSRGPPGILRFLSHVWWPRVSCSVISSPLPRVSYYISCLVSCIWRRGSCLLFPP